MKLLSLALTFFLVGCFSTTTEQGTETDNSENGELPTVDSVALATISIVSNSLTVLESSGTADVLIVANKPLPATTEVQLLATPLTADRTDFSEVLSFEMPKGVTEFTVKFPITDDSEPEDSENFLVELYSTNQEKVEIGAQSEVSINIVPVIKQVANSHYHACLVSEDGQIKCWGREYDYALGTGNGGSNDFVSDTENEMGSNLQAAILGDLIPVSVETSQNTTCALFTDNTLRCWGKGSYIGLNAPRDADNSYIGDIESELGSQLPLVELGTGRTAKQFSLHTEHSCAVLDNNRLKCWGQNGNGQLGYGDRNFRGDRNDELGDNLGYVDLGTDSTGSPWSVKLVRVGTSHSCAILSNDQIKCWGRNSSGQLGYGDTAQRGDGLDSNFVTPKSDEMGDDLPFVDLGINRSAKNLFLGETNTCAILDDDSLSCWGDDSSGPFDGNVSSNQLSPVLIETNGLTLIDVSLGKDHTCVLLSNNETKCIGANSHGQLGHNRNYSEYGNSSDQSLTTAPTVDFGTDRHAVNLVDGGREYTCAILNTNELKCWGYSATGALGNEALFAANIGDGQDETFNSIEELGDNLPPVKWY